MNVWVAGVGESERERQREKERDSQPAGGPISMLFASATVAASKPCGKLERSV